MCNTWENYMTNNFIANFIIFCRFNVVILKHCGCRVYHLHCRQTVRTVCHSYSSPNQKLTGLFKVCKSVHHRTIQINHQPEATVFQFIILTFIYSSTCFGRSPAHHQELNDCSRSLWLYLHIVVIAVLCSPAWPRKQHGYHHNTKVKPEAATAVTELLMMGGRTPETCWDVNKRHDNKLENCWIWLVIYLN